MEAAVLTSPSRTRLTGRGDIDDIRVVERVEVEQTVSVSTLSWKPTWPLKLMFISTLLKPRRVFLEKKARQWFKPRTSSWGGTEKRMCLVQRQQIVLLVVTERHVAELIVVSDYKTKGKYHGSSCHNWKSLIRLCMYVCCSVATHA